MAIMNAGQIVYQGTPQNAIDALDGKVFRRIVAREELETYANTYSIISNKMVGGQPLIHVFSETNPENGFELVNPNLEDVFFSRINKSNVLV
jgi:ABC-type multidrug transport system ATPase subunit